MRAEPEGIREGNSPHVPDGTLGEPSLLSPQKIHKIYRAFIVRYGVHGAIVLTRILAWCKSAEKNPTNPWGFRSCDHLAGEIPGLGSSAIHEQIGKLHAAGAIDLICGRPCGSGLNRANQFKVRPVALSLIRNTPACPGDRPSSPIVYFGEKDALAHGIDAALLLAYVEYHKNKEPGQHVALRPLNVSAYLGLKQRTVQRIIRKFTGSVLLEVEPGEPRAHHRFFEFHPDSCRGSVFTNNESRLTEEEVQAAPTSAPIVPLAINPDHLPAAACPSLANPAPPENVPLRPGDSEFRKLVESNKASGQNPDDGDVAALRIFLHAVRPNELLAWGCRSEDEVLSMVSAHPAASQIRSSPLGQEMAVLTLQLRRKPFLTASTSDIRRDAYRLVLVVTERLQELRNHRSQLFVNSRIHEKQSQLQPQEKVDLLVAAIHTRNEIGVEIPPLKGYECPNPKILRNYLSIGWQGPALAQEFFAKNERATAADFIKHMDDCALVPARPKEPTATDHFRHARSGTDLQALLGNLKVIMRELSSHTQNCPSDQTDDSK